MQGKVYLIGAGCGEADLITVRGLKKLLQADVVLYDALLSEQLLEFLPENVDKIPVGKRFNQKSTPQEKINELMIDKAKSGKIVARLKGGDPYVFGRGGEEAQALENAQIPYEVISGISSAIAVPASAGIPVTHRQVSRSLTVLTGSSVNDKNFEEHSKIDYKALVELGGTIVFLMGYHHIEEIITNFINAGISLDMPCAIISKGCTKQQNVIKGNIKNILEKVKKEDIKAPVIIIVGECVNLNLKTWDFYENFEQNVDKICENDWGNIKIGVTGTENFAQKLIAKIKEKNGEILDLSFLEVAQTNENLPDFKNYTWIIFTSQNGIEQFFMKLKNENKDIRLLSHLKFGVIGSGTAEKLEEYCIYPDLIPSSFDSKNLGETLVRKLNRDDKILLCRASDGSKELIDILEKNNCNYTDFHIYNLEENEMKKNIIFSSLNGKYFDVNYIVFGSAKGVEKFFDSFGKYINKNTKIVCIGQKCFAALASYNLELQNVLIAEKYNIDGIIECIEKDLKRIKYD